MTEHHSSLVLVRTWAGSYVSWRLTHLVLLGWLRFGVYRVLCWIGGDGLRR